MRRCDPKIYPFSRFEATLKNKRKIQKKPHPPNTQPRPLVSRTLATPPYAVASHPPAASFNNLPHPSPPLLHSLCHNNSPPPPPPPLSTALFSLFPSPPLTFPNLPTVMATIISPSSPSLPDDDDNHIPTATLALPSIATASASRRLPPPCWTPDETVALIDAYKDKWYSLRRGNLRANHWQEVADDVASRCPANPRKTAVQCRHKMEKLRKRYRAEIQRAAAHGGARRFTSSWAHFQNMHSMEKGTNNPTPPSSDDEEEEEEEDRKNSLKRINDLYNHHNNHNGIFANQNPVHNGATPGFRIKIPGGVTTAPAAANVYSRFNEMGSQKTQNPHNLNPRFTNPVASGYGSALKDGFLGKRTAEIPTEKKGDAADVGEVAAAIQALGEGFMRIEKAKMEMAQEVEEMRMEMELKRTEMILESQQRIVDAFAKAISERTTKKAKKNVDYA